MIRVMAMRLSNLKHVELKNKDKAIKNPSGYKEKSQSVIRI